ncbi:hypothetical protein MNBD_BACTEROID07-1806, partial [hydrothermal vent metagenome]
MFGIETWRNPDYFYLLLLIPLLIVWYVYRFRKSTPELLFSGLKPFEGISPSLKTRLVHSLFVLRMLALTLLIIA